MIKRIIYYFLHPYIAKEKVRWNASKKALLTCGKKSAMGTDFTLKGAKYISIGDNSFCGKNGILAVYDDYRGIKTGYTPALMIGSNVTMMDNCQISCANKIEVGSGTLIGDNVFITDNYHGEICSEELIIPPIERKLGIKGAVIIGQNVWIGRNVCILPGVSIGNGAIIGANAVVTKNIPDNCVAAGAPAKVLREIV